MLIIEYIMDDANVRVLVFQFEPIRKTGISSDDIPDEERRPSNRKPHSQSV